MGLIWADGASFGSLSLGFDLADYIVVSGATIQDGLLVIDLKRKLPEALKPRRVDINGS